MLIMGSRRAICAIPQAECPRKISMKLSDGEKLIVMMLCELYRKLGIEGEFDPEFVQSAILTGNPWGLDWKYGELFAVKDAESADVSEVVDILDMWNSVESSYGKLTEPEKVKVGT